MTTLHLDSFVLRIPAATYTAPTSVLVYTLPRRADGIMFTKGRFSAVLSGDGEGLYQGQLFASAAYMSDATPGNLNLVLNQTAASVELSSPAYLVVTMLDHFNTEALPELAPL